MACDGTADYIGHLGRHNATRPRICARASSRESPGSAPRRAAAAHAWCQQHPWHHGNQPRLRRPGYLFRCHRYEDTLPRVFLQEAVSANASSARRRRGSRIPSAGIHPCASRSANAPVRDRNHHARCQGDPAGRRSEPRAALNRRAHMHQPRLRRAGCPSRCHPHRETLPGRSHH